MPVNKDPNYLAMLFNLMGIASLLLVPKLLVTAANWRWVSALLLVAGWVLTGRFIWDVQHSLRRPHEQSLHRVFLLLSVAIVGFLVVGTGRFFTQTKLLSVSGRCGLNALVKRDFQRYLVLVKGSRKVETFDVTKTQFEALLNPAEKVAPSSEFHFYRCKQEQVTVQYIPHFGFFVAAE